jgi:bicarbonate transport system substrate-binding protein
MTPPLPSNYSRRQFDLTAGATAASTILLKGCINPPSPSNLSPKAEALELSPSQIPETTVAKLGYIERYESAY